MSLLNRKKKVVVIEHLPHFYEPEALEITVNGKSIPALGMWSRYRDGGTSVVETSMGRLHRPTPLRPGGIASLGDEEIDLEWIAKDKRKD